MLKSSLLHREFCQSIYDVVMVSSCNVHLLHLSLHVIADNVPQQLPSRLPHCRATGQGKEAEDRHHCRYWI